MPGAKDFTSGQITFIERLASNSGLDAGVIAAWCYLEENGGAAQARQASGQHNWLNIGYFDSGAGAIAFSAAFRDPNSAADQTAKFLEGKWGGASSGIRAILSTAGQAPGSQIAAIQRSGWASSGYPNFGSVYGSLDAGFLAQIRAGVTPGGTAGAGGSGSTPNQNNGSPFSVGDSSNPNEDYFTAINRLAQMANWYCFSDGETLYVADGTVLMQQTPAAVINLDSGDVLQAESTWDNSAFQYASNHRKRNHIQRRARLAKITSPTELTLQVVCKVDSIRGGDVVYVLGAGPSDGLWLVGEARRSVIAVYTELTLVPALAPISAAKLGGVGKAQGGAQLIDAMIGEANKINSQRLPYVHQGGRQAAGFPDVGKPGGPGFDGQRVGFDCSGAVAAVLSAGGLWTGPAYWIVANMAQKGLLAQGEGSGKPECTLYSSSNHMFMRLNGHAWGTGDGRGRGATDGQSGPGWIDNAGGLDKRFTAMHVPAETLRSAVDPNRAASNKGANGKGVL